MSAVADQPITLHNVEMANCPMIFLLLAIAIRSVITGTEQIAFNTADQTKALTGLIERKLAAAPSNVATTIEP